MDGLSKLPRETQVVLGGGVLLLILSFFDWQQLSLGPLGSGGLSEWRGIGVLAALLVIAMLAWEVMRLMAVNVSLGTLSPGLVSVGLALLMALFTVIACLTVGPLPRHWPAWAGLIVALIVAAAAVMRAKAEGVQMPEMPQGKPAESAGPAAPPVSSEPPEPASASEPMDAPSD